MAPSTMLGRGARLAYEYRVAIAFASGCLAVTLGLIIADAAIGKTDPWAHPAPDTRCEKARPVSFLREWANSLSNLGFVFTGAYAIVAAWWDHSRMPQKVEGSARCFADFPLFAPIFGTSCIFLGFGSFYYHACNGACPNGSNLDLMGIFLVIWSLLVSLPLFLLVVSGKLDSWTAATSKRVSAVGWFAQVIGWAVSVNWQTIFGPIGMANLKIVMVGVFALLLAGLAFGAIVARCRNLKPNFDYVLIPVGTSWLIIAVMVWMPEEIQGRCPATEAEMHALWHAALALALCSLFQYLRTLNSPVAAEVGLWGSVFFKDRASASDANISPATLEEGATKPNAMSVEL